MLSVQLNETEWELLPLPVTHVPPKAALITRCTTTTLHTPVPSIFAVQGVVPRAMFTPICTSITLTVPSAFRSQAFELLLLLLDVLLLDAAVGGTPAGEAPGPLDPRPQPDYLEDDHKFLLKGDVFTSDFLEMWISNKRREADALRLRPHPYEFYLYYDV